MICSTLINHSINHTDCLVTPTMASTGLIAVKIERLFLQKSPCHCGTSAGARWSAAQTAWEQLVEINEKLWRHVESKKREKMDPNKIGKPEHNHCIDLILMKPTMTMTWNTCNDHQRPQRGTETDTVQMTTVALVRRVGKVTLNAPYGNGQRLASLCRRTAILKLLTAVCSEMSWSWPSTAMYTRSVLAHYTHHTVWQLRCYSNCKCKLGHVTKGPAVVDMACLEAK